MSNLYIIDDDRLTGELLSTVCQALFINISIFEQARVFLSQDMSLTDTDVIILDLMMPDIDGIEVLRSLAEKACQASVILISGYDSGVLHSAQQLAQSYGIKVAGSFSKPILLCELSQLLSSILTNVSEHTPPYQAQRIQTKQSPHFASGHYKPSVFELKKAIEHKEFTLYFQPQVSLKTQQLTGVEALIRWQHPTQGLLLPDAFIPLAESSGLIEQLTQLVTELAIQQSKQWLSFGLEIKISINISAQNITSLTLPEQLTHLLKQQKIPATLIVLEITETALMGNITVALDILTRLRLKGFHLSIDDFGTGFSSLALLHKIPFTELKIDRSFVNNIATDQDCFEIVKTCIMLGHKLQMKIVAEGIEDQQTQDLLVDLGCDTGQGYFIAKPMSVIDISAWVSKHCQLPILT